MIPPEDATALRLQLSDLPQVVFHLLQVHHDKRSGIVHFVSDAGSELPNGSKPIGMHESPFVFERSRSISGVSDAVEKGGLAIPFDPRGLHLRCAYLAITLDLQIHDTP